jgi:hypothetical protein
VIESVGNFTSCLTSLNNISRFEKIIIPKYRTLVIKFLKAKVKAILVTGRGGPQGCETSWFPYFLDNRLTDGGEVVSLIHQQPFTPRKIPGTHFC